MLEVHSLVHRQKLLLAIVKPSDGRFHGSFDGTIYKLLLDLLPIGIPTGDDWTILSLLMPVNYRSENVCYAGGVPIKGGHKYCDGDNHRNRKSFSEAGGWVRLKIEPMPTENEAWTQARSEGRIQSALKFRNPYTLGLLSEKSTTYGIFAVAGYRLKWFL